MTARRVPALIMVLLVAAVTLVAGPSAADDKALAETLFLEGKEMMKQGKLAEACKRFEASHQAEPSVGALLNLARCHQELDRFASAWGEYRKAAHLANTLNQPKRRRGALEYAAKLEPQLSKLTIVVASPVQGLEVTRGNVVLPPGSYGVEVPVDGGAHIISASAPGYQPWTTEITLEKQRDRKTVEIPPLKRDTSQALPEPADGSGGLHPQETAGLVLAGVGAASLIAGTVLGVVAVVREDELACKDDKRCTADEFDDVEAIEPIAHASTVTIAAGGGLFILGGLLYLLAPGLEPAESAIRPVVGPTWLGLTGRF